MITASKVILAFHMLVSLCMFGVVFFFLAFLLKAQLLQCLKGEEYTKKYPLFWYGWSCPKLHEIFRKKRSYVFLKYLLVSVGLGSTILVSILMIPNFSLPEQK